jgi:hypothetical protein
MKVRCAWCGVELGEKEPLCDTRYTHGICVPCYRVCEDGRAKLLQRHYLDRFTKPVLEEDAEEDAEAVDVDTK